MTISKAETLRYYSALAQGRRAPIPFQIAVERLTARILRADDRDRDPETEGPLDPRDARNAVTLALRAALECGVSAFAVSEALAGFIQEWPEGGVSLEERHASI